MVFSKRTLDGFAPQGRRVFVRVDFNVPLRDGAVTDDTRIRAALPTLRELLDGGAKVIAASHLGRPGGSVVEELRMAPVAARLAGLLQDVKVHAATDVAGEDARDKVSTLLSGELLMLENLRFDPGETANDDAFAESLAALCDAFVQDAFGSCHRAHASTTGVPARRRPALAGRLLQAEIEAFDRVFREPKRPLVAVIGGAKVSDKILVLEHLIEKVDAVLVGGGMAYTFLRAQGRGIGDSLCEEDRLDVARAILDDAAARGVELLLPEDHVVADRFAADAAVRTAEGEVPEGWMGLDLGPRTRALYEARLAQAGTVVWNGPMGVFEMEPFAQGTLAVARAIAGSAAESVVGGGDSVAAVRGAGLTGRIGHVSTGGGAFLAMLEGQELPGIAALDDAPSAS